MEEAPSPVRCAKLGFFASLRDAPRPLRGRRRSMMWTLSPGSLRSAGVICISSRCPRPLRGRRYTHYFLPRPRPSSPRRLCMLLFIHSEAGDMYTLSHYNGSISSPAMHAITRLLRSDSDGLGETLSACAPLICCTPFPPPRSFMKDEREDGKEGSLVTVQRINDVPSGSVGVQSGKHML